MEGAEDTSPDHTDSSNASHRRNIPGNVLSRLPFMRSSSNSSISNVDRSSSVTDGSIEGERAVSPGGNSLSVIQQNSKIRKRKGSLRKTALLGKGMLGRDRKGSDAKSPRSPLSTSRPSAEKEIPAGASLVDHNQVAADTETKRQPSQEDAISPSTAPAPWERPLTSKISLPSIRSSETSIEPASSSGASVIPSHPSRTFDRSTLDEDDQALFPPKLPPTMPGKAISSGGDSYFPAQQPIPPFRSRKAEAGATNRVKSPLATQPQSLTSSPAPSEEEWDYSETAYWGYVILVITWLVFVVGMGSCFDVWSWAWDVGETPYAPPELNDDPTLPIVGYYPALMVLTSVMAWVWVVVAWVGMKYFRHAEGRADDG